jgi:hypothetical protein
MIIKIDSDRAASYAIKTINSLSYEPPMQITIEPFKAKRTGGQNRQQWPILNSIADQLLWPVNGVMSKLTGEEFKDILTAAYLNETIRLAQSVDGAGLVMLGRRTREFEEKDWSNWIEFLNWFASEKGVKIPISKSQEREYML